jgi:hypothetical protein
VANDDECIEVERNPEGAGMVVRVRFEPAEVEAVLSRAEFEDQPVTAYIHDLVVEHAQQLTWTKTMPAPWGAARR